MGTQSTPPGRNTQHASRAVDPGMLAQVTAAVVAAFRAGGGMDMIDGSIRGTEKLTEEAKAYSKFQLAKLKGFCCVCNHSGLLTIWEYFCTSKEVDVQWTQLVEEMNTWAKQHKVQINRGVSLQQINDG